MGRADTMLLHGYILRDWMREAELEAQQRCLVHMVGTTAKSSIPATLVEVGHASPAHLADPAAVHAVTLGALDALGVRSGPMHTELILTPSSHRIIETRLRLAGDDIRTWSAT